MFALEFREAYGLVAEEVFVSFFQILLGVRQSQTVHILQKGERVLVLRRRIFQHPLRLVVVRDFVVQQSVVDKPRTSKAVGKILFLRLVGTEPELVGF